MKNSLLELSGTKHAGCAAKINPLKLDDLLENIRSCEMPFGNSKSLFRSSAWEDVGAHMLSPSECIIMNIDMITPVVDDAFSFGKIATAHALSDIYAKGVQPVFAMNILAFPSETASAELASEILRGMFDQLRIAKVSMIGGHSIEDDDPKLGLAVVAFCDPQILIRNDGCRVGDKLVLTKKLGTGIIATALKRRRDRVSDRALEEVTRSMTTLNDAASVIMRSHGVHACTDVTGFGLAGHLFIMLRASQVSATINIEALPVFDTVVDLYRDGIFPQQLHHNMDFVGLKQGIGSRGEGTQADPLFDIAFDPQTSGGLLMSVAPEDCDVLVASLQALPIDCAVIGEIEKAQDNSQVFFCSRAT